MRDIENSLRSDLRNKEYAESYAESFLNAFIATQIKVIREQRGMTQAELGEKIGTTQAGVSRLENVDYPSWSIRTLAKMAKAFDIRLKVSFEPYGTLPDEVVMFNRESLQRVAREDDLGLIDIPAHDFALLPDQKKAAIKIDFFKALAAEDESDLWNKNSSMQSGFGGAMQSNFAGAEKYAASSSY